MSIELLEIWKDVTGFEGVYQVSNTGKVRNSKGLDRSFSDNGRGYLQVGLSLGGNRSMFKVHRLVALHFVPNPHGKSQVNHLDGDKYNNNDWNLGWSTNSENTQHAYDTGLRKIISLNQGSKQWMSKLTESDIPNIRTLISDGINDTDISKKFKVTRKAISAIRTGKNWKHV